MYDTSITRLVCFETVLHINIAPVTHGYNQQPNVSVYLLLNQIGRLLRQLKQTREVTGNNQEVTRTL